MLYLVDCLTQPTLFTQTGESSSLSHSQFKPTTTCFPVPLVHCALKTGGPKKMSLGSSNETNRSVW